ncbi:DUF4190 domain-containing protein [Kitasatospora sp. RB6PN24]|uniref:DUF4190 domain-containing protein n=1 Tax=Kitasatospora humi TaxID=2893891 RepID=UPI001E29E8AD|nr:DUF4190 domain-containing protein [Kitasatospora humi]MCC9308405.1 DUF4190 domain-containing protein [Kitasatospora humi]
MTDADTAGRDGAGAEQQPEAEPTHGEAAARPTDPWAPPADTVPAGGAPTGTPRPYPSFPAPPPFDNRPVVPGSNGLAIASLVTGVTFCLWPVALGLGIGALVQLRRRRQRGRGLAVAGTVLGLLGLTAAVGGVLAGAIHAHVSMSGAGPVSTQPGGPAERPGPSGEFAWKAGDCFTELQAGSRAERELTDCSKPHYGEVFFRTSLAGSSYPGVDAIKQQAGRLCRSGLEVYLYDPWAVPSTSTVRYLYPQNATQWARSGHTAICFLHDTAGNSTGSLRLDTTNLTQDQRYLLQALTLLDAREDALAAPVTDPAAATSAAAKTGQAIQQALQLIDTSQWSDAAKGPVAALVNSLRTDQAAWQAAGADTSDPLGAYQRALRDDNPLVAEVTARRAFSLIDHDSRIQPDDGGPSGGAPSDSPQSGGSGGTDSV